MTSANILIVDDEPANVRLLERLLQGAGYTRLEKTTDSRQVLTLFQTFHPDLILLDLLMPHLDGVAVLEPNEPNGAQRQGPRRRDKRLFLLGIVGWHWVPWRHTVGS